MKMQGEKGFTLIELVIVIVILGILAAVALPKFVALQRDARIAKLSAARGAVAAAAANVHSGYLARSGTADTVDCPGGGGAPGTNIAAGTLCTESGLIKMVNGYPAGDVALAAATPGIVGAAGLSTAAFSPNLAQLNLEGYAAVVAGTTTTFEAIGGTGTASGLNATCSFTYTAPTGFGAAPTISGLTTTDC